MRELKADQVFRGLLGHGMFFDQLPPIFSSETFMRFCRINKKLLPFKTEGTNKTKGTDYVRYESNRHNYQVRLFGVPNPFSYANLCWHIFERWEDIREHFKSQTEGDKYKVSRLHVRKLTGTPQIFKMSYANWKTDETPDTDLRIGAKFIVKTDISKCFPSIYSHAIPWALVGKEKAKRCRKKELWYNKLDCYIRNTTNAETHGILIGPHASNLISEIILTKVDRGLRNYSFVRAIDDYTCYVDSHQEGVDFLNDLRKELREYGLQLNDKKTDIFEMPHDYEKGWLNRIRFEKPIPDKKYENINYRQLQQYFDLVKMLLAENQDDMSVLRYAIKVTSGFPLTDNAKTLAQKFFLEMTFLHPYLISNVDKYLFEKLIVNPKIIEEWCNTVFIAYEELSNLEGLAYLFYFAIKYDFLLTHAKEDKIVKSNDCILKTLGAIYFKKTESDRYGSIYEDAKKLSKDSSEKDAFWLYWYTVLKACDLEGNWKKIKEEKISFIKNKYIL